MEHTKSALYDILIQSIESDDPQGYYSRAFATDPLYITDMYNKYRNTDSIDIKELFMTVEAKKREYGAMFAIIKAAWTASGKRIWTREQLKNECKGMFSESIMTKYDNNVSDFWKDNLYELFIAVNATGLQLIFSVHHDKNASWSVAEADDITAFIYPTNLQFNDENHIIWFIRRWADSQDTDLPDLLLFE